MEIQDVSTIGMDTYLSRMMRELNMQLPDVFNQFPALYGDDISLQLSSIVARYYLANDNETKVNRRLASVRKSIEHVFVLHFNIFGLLSIPK